MTSPALTFSSIGKSFTMRMDLSTMSDEHRIRVESIDVQWVNMIGGSATIAELRISSSL